MNATPNTKPFRPRKKSTAAHAQADFTDLPLSGANTEDPRSAADAPPESVPNSAAASLPPEASPSADVKSELAAAEPSTALTVVGDVRLAMRSEQTRVDIANLLETAKAITVITNADGRQQAHALLMSFVKARTSIDSRYDEVSATVRSFLDDIRAERGDLKQTFAEEETRIRKLRDAYDEEQSRRKREEAEANQRRIDGIRARIDDIKGYRDRADGKTAQEIQVLIQELVALPIDGGFAEFEAEASNTQAFTLDVLRGKHANAVEMERRAAELVEQERKLAQERAAQDLRNVQLAMIRSNFENRVVECASIGTLEAYDGVIDGLETYIIEKSDYGDVTEQAFTARASALDSLRTARAAIAQRLEDERQAKEVAEKRERATEAIRAIQDRVHTAVEGDSLEAYDLALSVTQGEAITEERFGAMLGTARTVQANTLATLRQRRTALEKRLADEAEADLERKQLEEGKRQLADQLAEVESQKEALRVQQESFAKPTDPVEATPAEDVTTVVADEAPDVQSPALAAYRPTTEMIVEAVVIHCNVSQDVAIECIIAAASEWHSERAA